MFDLTKFERVRVWGRTKSKEKRVRVKRRFLLMEYHPTEVHTIPSASFDTQYGDPVPDGKMEKWAEQYCGTLSVLRIYHYPGDNIENPTFEHLVGRQSLLTERTMMATIMFDGHAAITMPLESLVVEFDESVVEPTAEVEFTFKHEQFVFPGPWELKAQLTFKNKAQMDELTYVLTLAPSEEELAA